MDSRKLLTVLADLLCNRHGDRLSPLPQILHPYTASPLFWTGFRLISKEVAKNEFFNNKGIFSD